MFDEGRAVDLWNSILLLMLLTVLVLALLSYLMSFWLINASYKYDDAGMEDMSDPYLTLT